MPHTAVKSDYLVSFDQDFKIKHAPTAPPKASPDKDTLRGFLSDLKQDLAEYQRKLYAQDQYSLLLIFQAMDAAGKDSTIAHVFSGVDPAGCHVTSFKQPNNEELDHDFLWRCTRHLPERGRMGVFNRSYYEEVLAVRVHPEYLSKQKLPKIPEDLDKLWQQRFDSIRAYEKHLSRNGTVVLKFWLNVSLDEQRTRFLARIDEPEKNYKFCSADIAERQHWKSYMKAYEAALNETSRPHAPWYAIPADNKPFARYQVAEIIIKTLEQLDLCYPTLSENERAKFADMREQLLKEQ
jgi:PPK2 family polyphosphate:nucleotide phosphotransferase